MKIRKPTPHHKPKNVKLTNNLRWGPGGGPANPNPTREPDNVKPHHETSDQAARQALDRLIAAGTVKPIKIRKTKATTWDPANPKRTAPHYKLRNVRLTNGLARTAGTSTAARMTPDRWESVKHKYGVQLAEAA